MGDEADDAKKDLQDMGNTGSGAGEKLKTGLDGALKVIGAIAAAAVAVTATALEASQAAENVRYSFDQTFGDGAAGVSGWAENFSSAIHRSETEVKSFLTSNKQLYEGLGITGQAATDRPK